MNSFFFSSQTLIKSITPLHHPIYGNPSPLRFIFPRLKDPKFPRIRPLNHQSHNPNSTSDSILLSLRRGATVMTWSRSARPATAAVSAVAEDGAGRKWVVPPEGVNGDGGVEGVNGGYGRDGDEERKARRLLTLPTVLTLGRVAAVPLLVSTFYMDSRWATTATTSIFIGAAITDWLDGYLARKMQLGTTFGAFLDPVADKLMVATTLVLLCTKPLDVALLGELPWLLTIPSIAIIGREITMSAVREWAASQNSKVLEAVAVNNLGKWKTATQMTALTILLASRDPSLIGSGMALVSGVSLLYISAWLAVWSLVVYMRKIWRILLK